MSAIQLSEIIVYPVKSLSGISVEQWPVNHKGLLYDRHWMLIDSENQFLSQRTEPRMSLIKTALSDVELIVSAEGMDDLHIPLQQKKDEKIYVDVWKDNCLTHLISAKADNWFSRFLGSPCRMVCQSEEAVRAVDPRYARPQDQTSLSDGFPFLIIAENSLAALNSSLESPIEMCRFRPNLVLSGCPAYAEDSWREIRMGTMIFRLPKPCSRCSVPNVDPTTAAIGKEPLQTLSRTRKWQNKVYFGQNALHDGPGVLQRHMMVTVLHAEANQPPL